MSVSINSATEVKQEWEDKKYWVKPDAEKVVINQELLDRYWWWIHERQEIWHKRVILQEPAPWTENETLKVFKFTNAIRDLDRLTIYYIDNLLSHLEDTKESKKSLVLNTMIYRLFCRIETWELFGYIDIKDWEEKWPVAKEALRQRRADGHSIFTSAYYVNDLRIANPDPETRSNKTENAIAMIENWYKNIDTFYERAFENVTDMKEHMEIIKEFPAVGHFTAYEWACDFCLAERYTGIAMVPFDDDSYTNVGPGAKRGIDWIFESTGNMSDLQTIFWLRSIAKSEFERLGYDKTMKWPEKVKDFNLRVIEHDLCEFQKFMKAETGKGRPKVKFKPSTTDLSKLVGR